MDYKHRVRLIAADYMKDIALAPNPATRYLLMYNLIGVTKQQMFENHREILKREWMYELAKICGCTVQTLYRAKAAARCYKFADRTPTKYCQYAYNKMRRQLP